VYYEQGKDAPMPHSHLWSSHRASISGIAALLCIIGLSACAPGGTAAQATAFPGHHIAPQGPACDGALVPSDPVSPGMLYAFHFVGGDPTGVQQGQPMLSALDARTGAQRWQVKTLAVAGTLADGALYIDGSPQDATTFAVEALDAGTGKILWQHSGLNGAVGDAFNAPVVANGVVYVSGEAIQPGGQTGVYALRASDGSLLWSYPAVEINLIPISLSDGVLIVSTGGPQKEGILALRAGDGSLLWQHPFAQDQGSLTQRAVVAGGIVYFGLDQGMQGTVYALRLSDGQALWNHQVNGRPHIFGSTDTAVYVAEVPGEQTGEIDALKVSDGSLLWQVQVTRLLVYPTLADGAVYVNELPSIAAFDAGTGKLRWQITTHAPATGSLAELAEAGGIVYLASNGIAAFSASDGRPLWTHPANCQFPTQQPLLAIGNTVYYTYHYVQAVGKETYHVYALRAADGKALW
jgi:outer membrane protein assembly factor BamB